MGVDCAPWLCGIRKRTPAWGGGAPLLLFFLVEVESVFPEMVGLVWPVGDLKQS